MHTPCLDNFTHLSGIILHTLVGQNAHRLGKNQISKNLCLKMPKEVGLPLLKWDFGVLAPRAKPLILEFLALYEKRR